MRMIKIDVIEKNPSRLKIVLQIMLANIYEIDVKNYSMMDDTETLTLCRVSLILIGIYKVYIPLKGDVSNLVNHSVE